MLHDDNEMRETIAYEIPVILAGNEGIAPGLFVTLASIAVSKRSNRSIHFHFFDTGLSEATKSALEAFVTQFPNITLTIHNIDMTPFEGAPLMKGSYSTYARILFRRYIKNPKVLYFDTDVLVLKDIEQLFETDMDGNALLAATTPCIKTLADDCPFEDVEPFLGAPYFNSGVMLFDGDKWEEYECESKILKMLHMGIRPKMHDQTMLNIVLQNRWKQIDSSWNLIMIHNTATPLDTNFHFGGGPKPWQKRCTFRSAMLWWVVYFAFVSKFYQVRNAKGLIRGLCCREYLVTYLLPLLYPFTEINNKLHIKCKRLMQRRQYDKIFRMAEKELRLKLKVHK